MNNIVVIVISVVAVLVILYLLWFFIIAAFLHKNFPKALGEKDSGDSKKSSSKTSEGGAAGVDPNNK